MPQDLRAANLAALEMVDYVIIDPNPTPIEHIKFLQPDFFAKGYEYFSEGVPPKTQEEIDALESYGGEIVFTPGDVVYSSSRLIEASPPKLGVEKLLALMESEGFGFDELRETLSQVRGVRVHVVGDTIVDSYSHCSLLGATAKSPTFSVKHEKTDVFAGGAAVVAKHVKAAGGDVSFSTVLGNDAVKDFVLRRPRGGGRRRARLHRPHAPHHPEGALHRRRLQDAPGRPRGQSRDLRPRSARPGRIASPPAVPTWSSSATSATASSTGRPSASLQEQIPDGAIKVADSQVSNRWGNILEFTDFDLITPNEREARFALGDQDSVVRPLALQLFRLARCKHLILKLGERGILGYRTPGHMPREFFTVDSVVDALVDPVGAGDALLAYASLALARTGDIVLASILGSMAAAVACEYQGNRPVAPAEVEEKIDAAREAGPLRMRYLVVGLGNIGEKRRAVLGDRCVATVDPFNPAADYRRPEDCPARPV